MRLVLHDDDSRRHLLAMTHVSDLERDEVTAAQLAVDAEIEQSEFAHPPLHLQAPAQSPIELRAPQHALAN